MSCFGGRVSQDLYQNCCNANVLCEFNGDLSNVVSEPIFVQKVYDAVLFNLQGMKTVQNQSFTPRIPQGHRVKRVIDIRCRRSFNPGNVEDPTNLKLDVNASISGATFLRNGAGEEITVFACRCHYQYVFGASVGGSILEFYLKFGPLLHRFSLFEFAVGYHIGRIYVEELSIVGIGANFIRSVPIGERDVDAASVGAALKIGKLRRSMTDIHAVILIITLQPRGSAGKFASEIEDTISAVGAHIVAGEKVAGCQLAHYAYAHKLGVQLSRIALCAIPSVATRHTIAIAERGSALVTGAPIGCFAFFPRTPYFAIEPPIVKVEIGHTIFAVGGNFY